MNFDICEERGLWIVVEREQGGGRFQFLSLAVAECVQRNLASGAGERTRVEMLPSWPAPEKGGAA